MRLDMRDDNGRSMGETDVIDHDIAGTLEAIRATVEDATMVGVPGFGVVRFARYEGPADLPYRILRGGSFVRLDLAAVEAAITESDAGVEMDRDARVAGAFTRLAERRAERLQDAARSVGPGTGGA